MLEALPALVHGKVDRKALPDPGPGRLDSVAEYVAPRDPLEETLVRVWDDVLELEPIGVHDDFFDLGGHSLLAVQLVARLTAALNRPVSVKTVFQAPTVAAMADVLDARRSRPVPEIDRTAMATRLRRWPAGCSNRSRPFSPIT